jgi:hypothetical protein
MKRHLHHVLLSLLGAAALAAGSGSPVEKVVTLLDDMKKKLDLDQRAEQLVYDKYACWCETTTERKATAITAAQDELRSLGQSILKLKGEVATLTSEIEELMQAIEENKQSQSQATTLRQEQNGAFMAETTEMKQTLAALEQAIHALIDGTMPGAEPSMLLQRSTTTGAAVRKVIEVLPKNAVLKPQQLSLLNEIAASSGRATYAPQSLSIQGILKDMYGTFSTDLEGALVTEATRNRDFEDFIAVKTRQLTLLEEDKAKKEELKASAEENLANTQQSYDDTERQKEADIAFFDETKAACEAKHSDWTTRSSLRQEELSGITEAINILSTDAARELFESAIKPGKETGVSFLQEGARSSGDEPAKTAATKAYAALKAHATEAHSLRLASLAVQLHEAKVGHFDAVITAIDEMMKTLREEDLSDISKRDQCKDEYNSIASTIARVSWMIEKNEAKIDKLDTLIDKAKEEEAQTVEDISELEQTVADMRAQRESENQAFLKSKQEDQEAIDLLVQAKDYIMSYYTNHSIELGPIQGSVKGIGLAQQGPVFEISADDAPEAKFADEGSRKHEAKGVVSILTMIAEDLNDEIRNDMKAEELTHLAFEQQIAAADALMHQLVEKKTNLEKVISDRLDEKAAEKVTLSNNQADLTDEQGYKTRITPDCDWMIGAFEKRAAARAAEMSGLVSAKEFLAGFSEAALFEKGIRARRAEVPKLASIRFLGLKQ